RSHAPLVPARAGIQLRFWVPAEFTLAQAGAGTGGIRAFLRAIDMTEPDIILNVSNIESYYGPIMAIRGISLTVPRGKIVAVLGANGAGKTTILRTLSGIIDPQNGVIEFEGRP